MNWAFQKYNASGPVVVVFDVPEADRINLKPAIDLEADEDSWAEPVRDSRRGQRSAETKRADKAEWIYGPRLPSRLSAWCRGTARSRQRLTQQLAIKGEGAVDLFNALVLLVPVPDGLEETRC